MKPVFREVDLVQHIGRIMLLISEHCKEVTGSTKYNPDIDYALMGSKAGLFRTFIMEDGDEVVGYAVFAITKDFITSTLSANNIAVYVRPEYRGRISTRFMQYMEMMLLDRHAKIITYTVQSGSKAEKYLRHSGYSIREVICSKEF